MPDNRRAFLDMLAISELGRALIALSDRGYDVIVGSTPARPILFPRLPSGKPDYSRHPNKLVDLIIGGRPISSTAAGRYQILSRFARHYTEALSLPDFGPASQDRIALQLLRETGALDLIDRGNFEAAVRAARSRWASLPGAGYNQPEHNLETLRTAYIESGGNFG